MAKFEVWAPSAQNVEVDWNGKRLPMQQNGDGVWALEAAQAAPGDDYAFVVDGSKPLPDPRSPWQPRGVHGPSRLVDHGAFEWTDEDWSAPPLTSAVIYELHVGTFTAEGTFAAAIGRLDYLKRLGVTHVELMPVAEFPGKHGWGYDGVSLYAPKHSYGGPEGLKRLVNACHEKGLAVLLDVVYNHLGPDGNYLGQFGPYFTDRYRTPWGDAVNLDDAGSDPVRRFFIDNALMWLRDYHFDGLRLDAVHALFDFSATHFLEALGLAVQRLQSDLGRRLVLIAESDLNDPRVVRMRGSGGFGMQAQWSDDFHHALHTALTGEQDGYYADFVGLEKLAKALQRAYAYAGDYSEFRGRRHGRRPSVLPGEHFLRYLPGSRFLGYMQNHDQIGNRAAGERMGHLVDVDRVKVGAALVFTAPFVPMLFQGEEWGASSPFLYFTDHQDPQLAEAVRVGRQTEFAAFGWDPENVPNPQDEETFWRSKLDWSELEQEPHRSLLAWYRELIRLRREHAALQEYRLEAVDVQYNDEAGWLTLRRGSLVVACNFDDGAREVALPDGTWRALMASGESAGLGEDGAWFEGAGVVIVEMVEDEVNGYVEGQGEVVAGGAVGSGV